MGTDLRGLGEIRKSSANGKLKRQEIVFKEQNFQIYDFRGGSLTATDKWRDRQPKQR